MKGSSQKRTPAFRHFPGSWFPGEGNAPGMTRAVRPMEAVSPPLIFENGLRHAGRASVRQGQLIRIVPVSPQARSRPFRHSAIDEVRIVYVNVSVVLERFVGNVRQASGDLRGSQNQARLNLAFPHDAPVLIVPGPEVHPMTRAKRLGEGAPFRDEGFPRLL